MFDRVAGNYRYATGQLRHHCLRPGAVFDGCNRTQLQYAWPCRPRPHEPPSPRFARKLHEDASVLWPSSPGLLYQTPASIACIYGLPTAGPPAPGCNPNLGNSNPIGGSRAIAIVDPYDDAYAYTELQTFSAQFGLAAINSSSFAVVFAPPGGGTNPSTGDPIAPGSCVGPATTPPSGIGPGWDAEEALESRVGSCHGALG
jgi:hypothetical protein